MSLFKQGKVWWYEFWFAGRRIRESNKTGSKTVAKAAEQKRRREIEEGFNNLEDVRQERVRIIREVSDEYLASYRLRNPRSSTFAEYALGHIKRLLGDRMLVDIDEETVKEYYLAVGRSKTEAHEGRTIPLNSSLSDALTSYANWYVLRFGEIRPDWYVFPFGRPRPNDPTRPVTTLKTAWRNLRKKTKVTALA